MKIIKINAMWCPGCLITKSIWQEIEKEYPHHEYINLDYDKVTENKTVNNSDKINDETKHGKFKTYISSRRGKTILSMILIGILGAGAGFYVGTDVGRSLPATHKNYNKTKVLATVGDNKITGKDLARRMEPYFYYQGLKKLSDEEVATQETSTINYMTNLEALYQAGVEDKISVTDDEVNTTYSKTISTIESYFNMNKDEFLKRFDLSENYIKDSLKKEMIATKYLQDNSQVSEKEAKNYYNNNKDDFFEIRASHILISTYDQDGNELSDEQKEEKKDLAEKILKRAENGESFDDLALEYSDDEYTARSGGDLGYFSKGDMDENFEKAVFSLENKEIYPKVVETSYGYHIIKKTGEKYVDFDDEKDSLMETLSNNKQNTLLQDALEKYNVKINI